MEVTQFVDEKEQFPHSRDKEHNLVETVTIPQSMQEMFNEMWKLYLFISPQKAHRLE